MFHKSCPGMPVQKRHFTQMFDLSPRCDLDHPKGVLGRNFCVVFITIFSSGVPDGCRFLRLDLLSDPEDEPRVLQVFSVELCACYYKKNFSCFKV